MVGQSDGNNMTLGIGYGMGAGAIWGLVFVAPELVREFTPLQIAIGRYLAYGILSAMMLAPRWRSIASQLVRRDWMTLCWLGLTGNIVYFVLLSSAVHAGGIALTSLVIGFLPVAVTIIGSRDHNAVALTRLTPSLLLCTAGAICIGWQAVAGPANGASPLRVTGLFFAIGALISWTIFAVVNSRCLGRLPHLAAHDWNLLTGLVTGAQALLLIPVTLAIEPVRHSLPEWGRFALVSTGVAIFASILGNALWNRASRLLPMTLVGQMILFETLFALIYGFLWMHRLPTVMEVAAFALVVASVISCVAVHRRHGSNGSGQPALA